MVPLVLVLRNTETEVEATLATAISGLLSPSKSPKATLSGPDPTVKSAFAANVNVPPVLALRNTETVFTAEPLAACSAVWTSAAGSYDITLSGGSAQNYTFTLVKGTLTVTPTTNITDATMAGYSVYPNPSTDYIVIKSPNSGATMVKVYDVLGCLKLETKVDDGKLELNSLTPGIYNLKIDNYNFKLIKK